MKINTQQLSAIRKGLALLEDYNIDYEDETGYLDAKNTNNLPEVMEIEVISLIFPDDQEYTNIDTALFLSYMSEINTLRKIDERSVRTNHYVQTIISSSRMGYTGFEDNLRSFSFKDEHLNISIVDKPFLVGVMNAKESLYDENLGFGACEPYWAIELHSSKTIDTKRANEIVERICFFLTTKLGVEVYPSEVIDYGKLYGPLDEFYDDEEDNDGAQVIDLSLIPPYSVLHKMFRQAKGIEDSQIQFLQYYKIIEHASRNVAKSNAYNKLKGNVATLYSAEADVTVLDPILLVLRDYDASIKDDNLASSVIATCSDVGALYEFLPKRFRACIANNFKAAKSPLKEGIFTNEQLASLNRQIGSILYATRNRIVHAKADYTAKDNEFKDEELEEANKLMEYLTMSIINWNLRQPEGFRN